VDPRADRRSRTRTTRAAARALVGGATLLVVDDPHALVQQAVAAGATESSPVAVEHGWQLGRILDPFGHEWEIGKADHPLATRLAAGLEEVTCDRTGRVCGNVTRAGSSTLGYSTRSAKTQTWPSGSVAVNRRSPTGAVSSSVTSAPAAFARP